MGDLCLATIVTSKCRPVGQTAQPPKIHYTRHTALTHLYANKRSVRILKISRNIVEIMKIIRNKIFDCNKNNGKMQPNAQTPHDEPNRQRNYKRTRTANTHTDRIVESLPYFQMHFSFSMIMMASGYSASHTKHAFLSCLLFGVRLWVSMCIASVSSDFIFLFNNRNLLLCNAHYFVSN